MKGHWKLTYSGGATVEDNRWHEWSQHKYIIKLYEVGIKEIEGFWGNKITKKSTKCIACYNRKDIRSMEYIEPLRT